jgi:hypothetical protein
LENLAGFFFLGFVVGFSFVNITYTSTASKRNGLAFNTLNTRRQGG